RHPGLLIEDPRPAHVPAHYLAEVGRQLKDNLVGPVPRTAGQSRNRLLQLEKALRRVVERPRPQPPPQRLDLRKHALDETPGRRRGWKELGRNGRDLEPGGGAWRGLCRHARRERPDRRSIG